MNIENVGSYFRFLRRAKPQLLEIIKELARIEAALARCDICKRSCQESLGCFVGREKLWEKRVAVMNSLVRLGGILISPELVEGEAEKCPREIQGEKRVGLNHKLSPSEALVFPVHKVFEGKGLRILRSFLAPFD